MKRPALYPRGLLDPAFPYTPAASTDLRVTFKRIRDELAAKAATHKPVNVRPLKQGVKQ